MLGLVRSQYSSHGSRYSGLGIDDVGGIGMATDGTDAAGDRAGADAEERRQAGRNGYIGLTDGVDDDDCGN